MTFKIHSLVISLFSASLLFISCENNEPVIPNEEELITTLIYTLTPENGGEEVVFTFTDLDGDGGNSPVIETMPLYANKVYLGRLQLLNESESPIGNINEEISDEAVDHQFFFSTSASLDPNVEILYSDQDINGNPLGLETTLKTISSTSGTLTITLKHEPKKPNNGSLSDAGGETDIEVTFDVIILED